MGKFRGRTFLLFLAGAMLYAGTLAVCAYLQVSGSHLLELLTPLFGIPYLLAGGLRRFGWNAALYFLLLLPCFHYAAIQATIRALGDSLSGDHFMAGMAGGLVGGALSLLALLVLRMAERRPGVPLAAGIVALTLVGGLGVRGLDYVEARLGSDYGMIVAIYLPWQSVFAFFLSRLLPAGPRTADS